MADHRTRDPRTSSALAPPPSAGGAALEERDDEALMALAACDDRLAFEVLAGRYLGRVTSYAAKFLGSGRAGEEIAQDALLQAWDHRRRYRSRNRFQVFLFTLARNRCLNRVRDERRRLEQPVHGSGVLDAAADDRAGPLDVLLERERQRRTRDALLRIPPKLREAVLLRFDQELEYPAIARIVGRLEVTVRSRVFHGLRRLREALEREEEP